MVSDNSLATVCSTVQVNRSGKLENDAPQYSINAELTGLVGSVFSSC